MRCDRCEHVCPYAASEPIRKDGGNNIAVIVSVEKEDVTADLLTVLEKL